MIYDEIKNIHKYKGISRWFDHAADFLLKTDLSGLPEGPVEIAEDHVFANVMEADTKDEAQVFFEIHKKYWDIQLDIAGTEVIQIGLCPDWEKEQFDEETDFGTVPCKEAVSCVMGPGRFIICMQQEPHKPTLSCKSSTHVRKCVIKVEA